jgi:ketosteroid isomerase-like protein
VLNALSLCVFLVCSIAVPGAQPQPAQETPSAPDPQKIVETWFTRWNALDSTSDTAQALVDLYTADALHSTGPASHQLGTVTYRGHDGIQKMIAEYVAAFEKPSYRIETVTAKEQTARLFNSATGPWGGPSVAVEFVAAHTSRQDGKRLMYPGAAFFQIQDGKIRRLRIYMSTGELAEVEPDTPRRRPR